MKFQHFVCNGKDFEHENLLNYDFEHQMICKRTLRALTDGSKSMINILNYYSCFLVN